MRNLIKDAYLLNDSEMKSVKAGKAMPPLFIDDPLCNDNCGGPCGIYGLSGVGPGTCIRYPAGSGIMGCGCDMRWRE